jgi:hypothetical protein
MALVMMVVVVIVAVANQRTSKIVCMRRACLLQKLSHITASPPPNNTQHHVWTQAVRSQAPRPVSRCSSLSRRCDGRCSLGGSGRTRGVPIVAPIPVCCPIILFRARRPVDVQASSIKVAVTFFTAARDGRQGP